MLRCLRVCVVVWSRRWSYLIGVELSVEAFSSLDCLDPVHLWLGCFPPEDPGDQGFAKT